MILHHPFCPGFIGLVLLLLLVGCDRAPAPPASKPTASTPAPQAAGLPATAQSFETAKKWLYERVYYDHSKTFYCDCDCSRSAGQPGAINLRSCGLQSRQDPARAQRLEAEHAFPAAKFGNFRRCWREPAQFPDCVRDNGKVLTGRECCQKIDPLFESAHNDLYNLFPAEGEINGDRKDYNWGMVAGIASVDYGRCAFKIDAATVALNRPMPSKAILRGRCSIWPTLMASLSPVSTGNCSRPGIGKTRLMLGNRPQPTNCGDSG